VSSQETFELFESGEVTAMLFLHRMVFWKPTSHRLVEMVEKAEEVRDAVGSLGSWER
jgi:hypothetical protein